jgi:hypothetical protein
VKTQMPNFKYSHRQNRLPAKTMSTKSSLNNGKYLWYGPRRVDDRRSGYCAGLHLSQSFWSTSKLYQNVYPYLKWILSFWMDFILKVLLRILSIVNILNTAYPFRPKFYPP